MEQDQYDTEAMSIKDAKPYNHYRMDREKGPDHLWLDLHISANMIVVVLYIFCATILFSNGLRHN